MKFIDVQQNSLAWLVARAGLPTASEFDNLVTGKWKIRTGQMPRTYLACKVAEKWLGGPLPGFNTLDMEFGKILEEEALPFYTLETSNEIERVGMITTDDGKIGCSPDAILKGQQCGLEIKCPSPGVHVNYLLEGVLPDEYAAQVYGSMFVTGFPRWVFMSYCRRFPPLILTIEMIPDARAALSEALDRFCKDLDDAYGAMLEMNGGVPPKKMVYTNTLDDISPDPTPIDINV
jgi:hypothetical protein